MKNRIITISREFGSGGRTIGRQTAEKLSLPCYDHELIVKLAEESGFAEEYIAEQSEYTAHSSELANAFSTGYLFGGVSNQDRLWIMQRELILKLAQKGPCVIVGRCADYILREEADLLKVFIHADPKKRAQRIVEIYGERDASPEKRIKDKDKRRSAYYRFYTDLKWGVAQNYHISLDSGALGIDRCVQILTELY